MARKVVNDGITRYICEECGKEMFAVFNNTHNFTKESKVLFKKYLNFLCINGPYYSCQYCNAIHEVSYSDNGSIIDFKILQEYQYHTAGE